MELPSVYDATNLANFMHGVLGEDDAARDLNWSVAQGDYDEPVVETMLAYGVDDLGSVTGLENIRRLRAIARRELWRTVMQRTVYKTDTNTEGGNEAHSQLHRHARQMFEMAGVAVMEAHTAAVRPPAPPAGGPVRNVYVPWGSK